MSVVQERQVTLTIGSRLEDVALVGVATNRICRFLGYPAEDAARLELCVVEAVTNAVRHAYSGGQGGSVSARLTAREERLEIRVIDHGRPVPASDRRRTSPAFDPADPTSIPESGRGLVMIHELMDHVEFTSDDGANVLLMVKALPAPAGAAR